MSECVRRVGPRLTWALWLGLVAALIVPATACATSASGVVSEDTTWTAAGSPWVLTGDVVVKNGARLVLEPGAIVQGASHSLEVYGRFEAAGTEGEQVVLRNVDLVGRGMFVPPSPPTPSLVETFAIGLRHADVDGGSLQGGDASMYGSWSITDSIVSNTTAPMHLWYPLSDCVFERNVFINAGKIIAELHLADVYLTNNLFFRTEARASVTDASLESWSVFSGHQIVARGNTFSNTAMTSVAIPSLATAGAIDAGGNYWGTADPAAIAAMVFDRNDDLSSPGYVNVESPLDMPDPATPQAPSIATAVTLNSSSLISNSPITIRGSVQDLRGARVAASKVEVQRSLDRVTWYPLTSTSAASDGHFAVTVNPPIRTYYRLRSVDTSPVYAGSAWVGARVLPRAKLSIAYVSSARPLRRKLVSLNGYLSPRHAARARSVVVLGERYERGRWVRRVRVYAVNANAGSITRYSTRFAFPYPGRWRVRVYHSDALHAPSYSKYKAFTVR